MKLYRVTLTIEVEAETEELALYAAMQVDNSVVISSITVLEEYHHPDCPATDGFGCRCDELM